MFIIYKDTKNKMENQQQDIELSKEERENRRYEIQKEKQRIKYQNDKNYREKTNERSRNRYKKIKEIVEIHKQLSSIKI